MKTSIVLLACVAYAAAQPGCPNIVSRSQWGARPPKGTIPMYNPVAYVIIHHSAGSSCTTQPSCSAEVRAIQNQHMNVNGLNDIGYSFLVGEDGNAYEGRGWSNVGAHAPGYNDVSIGICFIGTYTSRIPNNAAIDTCKQLIQCGMDARYVQYAHSLIAHPQAVVNECPGDALYAEIQTWDNYEPNL